jgi:hypothetical protein
VRSFPPAVLILASLLLPAPAFPGTTAPVDPASPGESADRLGRIERAMWERDGREIPALRDWAARDGNEKVRERAVGALTLLRDVQSQKLFLDRLSSDPSPAVRRAAADAIGTLGVPVDRMDRLTTPLQKDPDAMVRAECARAIGRTGVKQAAGILIYALVSDPAPEVRALSAEALSRLGAKEAGEILRTSASTDGSILVRLSSVRALRLLLPQESLETFRALWQEDADPDLRLEAFRGLLATREKAEWSRRGLKEKEPAVRAVAFREWVSGLDLQRRKERLARRSGEVLLLEELLKDPAGSVRELSRSVLESQGYKVRDTGFSYAIIGD